MRRIDLRSLPSPGRLAAFVALGLGAVAMVAPFWFTFVFATRERSEIFSLPPPLWFGDHLLANLRLLQDRLPFWRNLGMSLYVASMATALNLAVCAMAGHAFAVHRFRFQRPLMVLVVGSMMVPPFLNMIPGFLVMDWLGWIDQPRALWVPGATGALGVVLMRQYIAGAVPRELLDAARLDGCGELRLFLGIVLPLCRPALATLGLVTFIGAWNNFLGPLVVMRSPERFPVPLALRSLQSPDSAEWGAVMAGTAIAMLPLLAVFFLSARRLVAGLTAGAVRG